MVAVGPVMPAVELGPVATEAELGPVTLGCAEVAAVGTGCVVAELGPVTDVDIEARSVVPAWLCTEAVDTASVAWLELGPVTDVGVEARSVD